MDKKTVSNKTVIVVAIICVVLFGLMMVGAFMMTGGSNSGDLENYNAEFSDGVKLTWDELMKEENGEKYGYKADRISKEEIGIDAFKGSELVQIKVPETVTNISKTAFCYSPKLKLIQVVSTNPVYASTADGCLYFKETTTLQSVPATFAGKFTIANGTTEIGDYALANCVGITEIIIPETVTKIGKNAFESIRVESLTIPVTVQSIGKNAFANIEKMHIEYHGTMKEWCKVLGVLNLGDLNNEIEVETAPNEN
jgi:hypothetical protein